MFALLMRALNAYFDTCVHACWRQKHDMEQPTRTRFFQVRDEKPSDFFGIGVETRVTAHDFRVVDAPDVEKT